MLIQRVEVNSFNFMNDLIYRQKMAPIQSDDVTECEGDIGWQSHLTNLLNLDFLPVQPISKSERGYNFEKVKFASSK